VFPPEKAVHDLDEPCLFVGNGSLLYQHVILDKLGNWAYFAPSYQNTIRASTVAYMSLERFENKDFDDVEVLAPQYIRKSDAELSFMKSPYANS